MPETITRLVRADDADDAAQSILECHVGLGPRDEDIAFIIEGLHEVTDLYHEMSELLVALAELVDSPDLPAALRPIVKRAHDLTFTHQAPQDAIAVNA